MSDDIVKEDPIIKEETKDSDIDKNKLNKKKEEEPDDQDIIDEIQKVKDSILKTKLLYLNKLKPI